MISKEIKLALAAVLVVAGCKDIQAQTPGTVTDNPRPLVSALLDRSNAVHGLVFGNPVLIECPVGSVGWQIRYHEFTQGQGFYESSGGLTGDTRTSARPYLNANKSDGTYTGSVSIECFNQSTTIINANQVDYELTITGQLIERRPLVNTVKPSIASRGEWVIIEGENFLVPETNVRSLQVWLFHENGGAYLLTSRIQQDFPPNWEQNSIGFRVPDQAVSQSGRLTVIVNDKIANAPESFAIN